MQGGKKRFFVFVSLYLCKVQRYVSVGTETCKVRYGVATISRMLKNIGLFCKRDL